MGRPTRKVRNGPGRSGGAATLPARTSPAGHAAEVSRLLAAALQHHQAGRRDDAERLYREVLRRDAAQPDALHLLGVLALQDGRAAAALPLIEQALTRRPNAPAYHLNLGNVLFKLGRRAEAIASYRRAADLEPTDPEAHFNLGNALVQTGQIEDGVRALQRATALYPEHPSAQYSLGNALRDLGRLDEAVTAYAAVTSHRPDFADAFTAMGAVLHARGRLDESRTCFERALALRPNDVSAQVNVAEVLRASDRGDEAATWYARALDVAPDHPVALHGLAAVRTDQGNHAEAADLLRRRVTHTPDDPASYQAHAQALMAAERPEEAIEVLISGLERHPGVRPLIGLLVEHLQTTTAVLDHPVVRSALLAACTDDTFNPYKLMRPVLRIIWSDPACQPLLKTVQSGADPFGAGAALPTTLTDDPLVLAALPRVVLCSPNLERILTALRRFAFLRAFPASGPGGSDNVRLAAQPLSRAFLCALARASFLVEFSWLLEPDEIERVSRLRAVLDTALADATCDPAELEDLLLLAALYEPLGRLPGAERLVSVPATRWSAPFAAVVREQAVERLQELAIKATLPALTPIDNHVSSAVRAMYEENPYPRWRAARFVREEPLQALFRQLCPGEPLPDWPAPLPVLVAGAGSGQHPVETAMTRREADVLAVDLSRTSLAYGARMARHLGVQNIRFAQADILALDALDRQFVLIECAGVLHHLENPLDGWRVLRRLLRPDGLMRIGLYSERARAGIVAARTMIARTHVPPTVEGIQLARRLILSLPEQHPAASVAQSGDFYSMSGFRDLVMHVQEHRYTLPQLAETLDLLDLRFLGFNIEKRVLETFRARFPEPGAERDLACWDQFEAENPETFIAMYQFWCGPR